MNIRKSLCAIFASALIVAGGCESEGEYDSAISITPGSCQLSINQSKIFTASGGENYRWSVGDSSLGTISSSTGSSVTYTATSLAGNQVLTVTGTDISGEEIASANAAIQQVDPEANKPEPTPDPAAPVISGDSTVQAGTSASTASLTATGGDGKSYKWSLSNTSIGRLTSNSGNAVGYVPNANTAGQMQQVTVSSGGRSSSFNISHGGSTSDPTAPVILGDKTVNAGVIVSSASLSATGGDGKNYTWSLANASIGTLSATSGSAVGYTPKANTAGQMQQVVVTSAGMTSSFNISHASSTSDLTISGDSSVKAGSDGVSVAALKAAGGDGRNYTWTLSNSSIGSLTKTSGNAVGYMPNSGTQGKAQQITVSSGGLSTSFIIKHEGN